MQIFFDYWGAVVGLATIILGALALRSPKVRKKLGLTVRGSQGVEIGATDKTEAEIDIDRSQDVKVKIGDTER